MQQLHQKSFVKPLLRQAVPRGHKRLPSEN
jgi:hypothetical protein